MYFSHFPSLNVTLLAARLFSTSTPRANEESSIPTTHKEEQVGEAMYILTTTYLFILMQSTNGPCHRRTLLVFLAFLFMLLLMGLLLTISVLELSSSPLFVSQIFILSLVRSKPLNCDHIKEQAGGSEWQVLRVTWVYNHKAHLY